MSDQARQVFYPRASRYVLRPGDDKLLRFSPLRRRQIYNTEIMNMSESGLAFTVEQTIVPVIGEQIKLEFAPPGEDQRIAWIGKVVRIEYPESDRQWMANNQRIVVAVKFVDLPEGHRHRIVEALNVRFDEQVKTGSEEIISYRWVWLVQNWLRLLGYLALSIALLFIIFQLMRNPDASGSSASTGYWERIAEMLTTPPKRTTPSDESEPIRRRFQ